MKTILLTTAALLLATNAFAADQAGTVPAKIAACKAQAKTDGLKATQSEFYGYMSSCLDRIAVSFDTVPAK